MKRYNHMYDIAFTVINNSPEGNATADAIRKSIHKALFTLDDDELLQRVELLASYVEED